MARVRQKMAAVTDSEFYIVVCFSSAEEKRAFLRKRGLHKLGEKFMNGRQVDEILTERR